MLFHFSVVPILSGDSCYFNFFFTLSALIMLTLVPAWRERKEQVSYRCVILFGSSSSSLHILASYLKSIFSVITNLNKEV